jgi:hypothetical protein
MSRQVIDTTAGAGDSGKAGGDKINAMFAELYGMARPFYYAMASRSSGNVTAAASNSTFINFDTGIDLVLTAKVGDVIDVGINCQAADGYSDRGSIEWNFEIINGGVATNRAAGALNASTSIGSWTIRENSYFGQSAALRYVVKQGDIDANGKITIRLKVRTNGGSGQPRSVFANNDVPFFWDAQNRGTPAS